LTLTDSLGHLACGMATGRGELTGPDGAPLPATSAIPNEIHITINAEGEEDEDEYKIVPLKPDAAS
jgi:hypothetical protein